LPLPRLAPKSLGTAAPFNGTCQSITAEEGGRGRGGEGRSGVRLTLSFLHRKHQRNKKVKPSAQLFSSVYLNTALVV
jgi:hypothetical protein